MQTPEVLIMVNCLVGTLAGGVTITAFIMVLKDGQRPPSSLLDWLITVRSRARPTALRRRARR
jgi:hypothetical protein